MTWDKAKSKCERLGGQLPSIKDRKTNDFFRELSEGKGKIWLGGYKKFDKGVWIDGSAWKYQNWIFDKSDDYDNEEEYDYYDYATTTYQMYYSTTPGYHSMGRRSINNSQHYTTTPNHRTNRQASYSEKSKSGYFFLCLTTVVFLQSRSHYIRC